MLGDDRETGQFRRLLARIVLRRVWSGVVIGYQASKCAATVGQSCAAYDDGGECNADSGNGTSYDVSL
jgi:hypothetical protein